MIRVLKVGVLIAVLGILVFGNIALAAPGDYQLIQEIGLIDCTKTQVQDGSTVIIDSRCTDAVMPTVDMLRTQSTPIVINGTYESLIAESLRVYFAGIWYTLGADNALMANGSAWRLEVGEHKNVGAGNYDVIAEVVTKSGLLLRDQTAYEIEIYKEPTPEPVEDNKIIPFVPNTGFFFEEGRPRYDRWYLSLAIISFFILIVLKKLDKKSEDSAIIKDKRYKEKK